MRIRGEVDLGYTALLEEAIAGEIARGRRHLVIDLTAATLLDCAGVGALLTAVAPLRDQPDATVVLAGASGIVKRLFDLLRLDRFFDILPDLDRATEHATATDRRQVDGWRDHDMLLSGRMHTAPSGRRQGPVATTWGSNPLQRPA